MGDEFVWREEAEAFSRPVVNQLQNGIHLLIGNLGEISPSREEKAEQSINIFITTALPRSVSISKIDFHIQSALKILESKEFCAVIQRQGDRRNQLCLMKD